MSEPLYPEAGGRLAATVVTSGKSTVHLLKTWIYQKSKVKAHFILKLCDISPWFFRILVSALYIQTALAPVIRSLANLETY